MKILLACDVFQSQSNNHTQAAEELLDLTALEKLVPLAGSEVTILYVKEELPSYERVLASQADFKDDLSHLQEERANKVLESLAATLESRKAQCKVEIVSGPPAFMIEEVAKDNHHDLIVITSGTHKNDLFKLGSVSSQVARHAVASTLVLHKQSETKEESSTIVIGIDGSASCLKSITNALSKLDTLKKDSTIHLAHIVKVSPVVAAVTPFAFVTQLTENLLMEGEVYLTQTKNELANLGYNNVELHLSQGEPAKILMDLAASLNARLILLGAQGKGAIKHFILGHVADRVVNNTDIATLLARPQGKTES
jgi:nucleotide-binding universal stress UspA family protein